MFTVFLASLATCYFVAPLVTSCFKKHSAKFEQYDDGRQKYIVKSVMKSVILALLCTYGMWIATVGSWNNDAITFTCNIALATAPPSLELGFCTLRLDCVLGDLQLETNMPKKIKYLNPSKFHYYISNPEISSKQGLAKY